MSYEAAAKILDRRAHLCGNQADATKGTLTGKKARRMQGIYEDIAREIRDLTPPAPDGEWQLMETAPRDGTKFIAAKFVGHPDHNTCFWWASSCSWSEKWQKWWDGVEPCGLADPSHWKPVVNPPFQDTERSG